MANAAITALGSIAYHAVADPASGFSHQLVTTSPSTFPQEAGYQITAGPTPGTIHSAAAPYPYGTPMPYHFSEAGYGVDGVQVYAEYGNVQPTRRSSNHAYTPGYGDAWPSEAAAQPPQPGQIVNYNGSESPGVVIEQRKIIIRNLDRAGLSEATILDLIAQHTGIMGTTAAGQIERVEVRINNDGRARGTAFVTFCAPELARIAIAALEGREIGDRQISARFTTEGVSSSGGVSSRPGRRLAGGGGGGGDMNARSDGGAASKHSRLSRGHAAALRSAAAAPSAPPSAAASVSGLVSVGNGSMNEKKEGPPVVVDGSGGRWKKEMPPVVVDGSAGKQGQGVALW